MSAALDLRQGAEESPGLLVENADSGSVHMGKVSDHSDAVSPGSETLGRIIGCLPRRKRPGGEGRAEREEAEGSRRQ